MVCELVALKDGQKILPASLFNIKYGGGDEIFELTAFL